MTETQETSFYQCTQQTIAVKRILAPNQKGKEVPSSGEIPKSITKVCEHLTGKEKEKTYYCTNCKGNLTLYCQDCIVFHTRSKGHPYHLDGSSAIESIFHDMNDEKGKVTKIQEEFKDLKGRTERGSVKLVDMVKSSDEQTKKIQDTVEKQQKTRFDHLTLLKKQVDKVIEKLGPFEESINKVNAEMDAIAKTAEEKNKSEDVYGLVICSNKAREESKNVKMQESELNEIKYLMKGLYTQIDKIKQADYHLCQCGQETRECSNCKLIYCSSYPFAYCGVCGANLCNTCLEDHYC